MGMVTSTGLEGSTSCSTFLSVKVRSIARISPASPTTDSTALFIALSTDTCTAEKSVFSGTEFSGTSTETPLDSMEKLSSFVPTGVNIMLPVTTVSSVTYCFVFLSTQPYVCFLFEASGSLPIFWPERTMRFSPRSVFPCGPLPLFSCGPLPLLFFCNKSLPRPAGCSVCPSSVVVSKMISKTSSVSTPSISFDSTV